jgi:uncharacterized protein YcbX
MFGQNLVNDSNGRLEVGMPVKFSVIVKPFKS